MRIDGRSLNDLRKISITPHAAEYAEGSCLVEFGKTKILCTASLDEQAPKWLQGSGKGWVTAEYGMIPRSTHTRIKRDKAMASGRTQEISRLIARALRSSVDLKVLVEKQIIVDCDVLQADGGTRTAAITGGFVALALALKKLKAVAEIKSLGLECYVAAVSIGLKEKQLFLDLNYDEDSVIGTDMNFVMNSRGEFIEVQGTAESEGFSPTQLNSMMSLAQEGIGQLFLAQEKILGSFFPLVQKSE